MTANLEMDAEQIRRDIVTMIHRAGSGHSGGSLSAVEILTCLYGAVMRHDPGNPEDSCRDRFILSKGHAAPALYAVLSHYGYFPKEELMTLRCLGSRLQGHPCRDRLPGIELSTGSLGLGISAGLGMALASGISGDSYRVFVLCGDGELNEGQNWEAFMAMNKWKPHNLTVIVDYNRVQLDGTAQEIMPMGSLRDKIQSFGLKAVCCDGHDVDQLMNAFNEAGDTSGPCVILAYTVKGKGVSFMEGKSAWHGKTIGDQEYEAAMAELGAEESCAMQSLAVEYVRKEAN